MEKLFRIRVAIDSLNSTIGTVAAWLLIPMVLLKFATVLLRYVFGFGALPAQELVIYLHAAAFILAAGYTLLLDQHPRVDFLYRRLSLQARAWVNIVGVLAFLLPACIVILLFSWEYIAASWRVLEGSTETSGIKGVFLLKSLIGIFAVLVALQGFSLLVASLYSLGFRR